MTRFAVVGATSWGVTLARLLLRNGSGVTLVTRDEAEAESLRQRRGIARMPDVTLDGNFDAVAAANFVPDIDGIVAAMPAQSLRATMEGITTAGAPVLSAAKGIEIGTGKRMSEVLQELFGGAAISVISGPNLSREVATGLPAAAVIACTEVSAAQAWQAALSAEAFRLYTSSDVVGVELGGALKNVVAIAAGAAWGLEFGANAVATIMTRGLAEMTRLGVAMGAYPLTFQGLAGVGDLAATCYSPLSRNRRLGELLAQGRPLAAALLEIGEAVEGAATAHIALELALKHGVAMPLTEEVVAVLDGERTVAEAMHRLLTRPLRPEAALPPSAKLG